VIVGTGGERSSPPPAVPAVPAQVDVPAPAESVPPPPLQTEPKKKRGFWSRFFGIGKEEKKKPPR
jgi:hypothetical protein